MSKTSITRVMPLKAKIMEKSRDMSDSVTIPCSKCGAEGALDQGAYMQVILDYDEVTFICNECHGPQTISEFVEDSKERGLSVKVTEGQISSMIRMVRPDSNEAWDKLFQSLAYWAFSGVELKPGKYGLEVTRAMIKVMVAVPAEERDEGWRSLLAACDRMVDAYGVAEAQGTDRQWTRD